MSKFISIKTKIIEMANEILQKNNLCVYDVLEIKNSEFESDVLQILVEDLNQPNKPLDFDILSTVTDHLSEMMDSFNELSDPYMLEIASAGIEKNIRNFEELKKALNQYINVVFKKPINGLQETNGTLVSIDGEEFTIEYFIKGQKKKSKITWKDISKIRYAVKF
ncbi:ribosome maturation factor RimP [Williamsoniiplasma somnilux]|uniref:Ribosome maturation factor RimP n=1 Tax=Williamsoniiplasma somnilux TaxID=215578 RepID=A0A2K8P1B5_9MOLU|nr:ribosome assembly cofactor RimP [Williamsoniiplasma somnilux]ATZ18693.1 ribosome maturation factor RimP [Williamsoniiplasma somnilux]